MARPSRVNRAQDMELEQFRLPGREYDRLGRLVPRNPFRDKAGVLLLLKIPGFCAQFERRVPDEYRLGSWVLCTCGELLVVELAEVAECPGRCTRWFLGTESGVRVARWPYEDGEIAA